MNNIYEKELLKTEYNYKKYCLKLNYKGNKTIFAEKDYENLCMVDIKISEKEEEYVFSDYYIKINPGILDINSENIAKKIIEKLHTITFENSKFIGEIKKVKYSVSLFDNKLISLALKLEKNNTIDETIYNIYRKYIELKGQNDKNIFLKYASFLEIYFSTHLIPDILKKEYVKNIKKKIFDYELIDKNIKEELVGNTYRFQTRFTELNDNSEKIIIIEKQLRSLKIRLSACEEVINKIDEFINEKKKSQESKQKIIKLKEQYSKVSLFSFKKRNQIKNEIKEVKNNNKFNFLEEEKEIKIFIRKKTAAHIIESFKGQSIEDMRKKIKSYYEEKKKEHNKIKKEFNLILKHEKEYNKNFDLKNIKNYIKSLSFDDLQDSVYE